MQIQEPKGVVYVLALEQDRFYVGKTTRPLDERLREHFSKGNMKWTRQYPLVGTLPPLTYVNDLESWERAETLERIWLHGAARVRGWQYTSTNYTEADRSSIVTQICERKDLCRKCGNTGHLYSDCKRHYKKAAWMRTIFSDTYTNKAYFSKIRFLNQTATVRIEESVPQPIEDKDIKLIKGPLPPVVPRTYTRVDLWRVLMNSNSLKFQLAATFRYELS
jgi:predicted GIY-YIG superfamily endonuclease